MYYELGMDLILDTKHVALENDCVRIFSTATGVSERSLLTEERIITAVLKERDVYFYRKGRALACVNRLLWISTLLRLVHNIALETYKKQYILIHGSCVKYGTGTVIFLGHSRSGKSMATYKSMLELNAAYVSDDMILYDPSTKHIIPQPYKAIQLRQDSKSDLPILKASGRKRHKKVRDAWDMEDVCFVSPEKAFPKQVQYLPLKVDCFIEIRYVAGGVTHMDILPPRQAFQVLLKHVFNISLVKPEQLVSMLDHLSCFYQCTYGGNIKEVSEVMHGKRAI